MSRYRGTSHDPSDPPQQSATTRAYLHMKDEILTCRFPPGSAIFEGELASTLGMSKTPVREALGMLSHEGFVEVRPRQGYRVTDVTLADVHELFHLRMLLEPAAARLAARNASPAQLAELRALAADQHAVDYAMRVRRAGAFHDLLAQASGSERLWSTLGNLLQESQRLFFVGLELQGDVDHQGADHESLVDALEAGDAERAEAIARRQAELSRDSVISAIMTTLDGPGASLPAADVKLGQP